MAVGRDDERSWIVSRAIPGEPVEAVLNELDATRRRHVGHRLGELLQLVHAVPVPGDLDMRAGVDIVGEDILPLPVPRARGLVERLASEGCLDAPTAVAVDEQLDSLEPLDPFVGSGVVVHGDAGIENLLWAQNTVVALLDFEWARSGQAWVDLVGWMLYGDREVAQGVMEAYPEPFRAERAHDQLMLLEIATALRTLATWPGPRNAARLRTLLTSRDGATSHTTG